ncbi:hypothetical protein HMPREF1549_03112 [Actinomyces johnsonii F0510]|uniref:Uncharacterized protein n=1 Tax=Actinomyces johnsonii F0510 TaxID=1227262 RepID=U1R7C5_9ACTO|nr:hypothetical protein HMPREF1549_03112 [Actinomyces johnsonii F0510]
MGSRCATASTLPAHPSSAYTGMAVSVAVVLPIRDPHQAQKRHSASASSPCGAVLRRPGCFSLGHSGETGGADAVSAAGSLLSAVPDAAPSASFVVSAVLWLLASARSESSKGSRT